MARRSRLGVRGLSLAAMRRPPRPATSSLRHRPILGGPIAIASSQPATARAMCGAAWYARLSGIAAAGAGHPKRRLTKGCRRGLIRIPSARRYDRRKRPGAHRRCDAAPTASDLQQAMTVRAHVHRPRAGQPLPRVDRPPCALTRFSAANRVVPLSGVTSRKALGRVPRQL